MPAAVEKCVRELKGTNKRTGKPYTQSEKWAICQAAHKRKGKSSVEDYVINEEEIAFAEAEFDAKMESCHKRMMKMGRAKNMDEAHQLCMRELAKSSYNLDRLEFFLDMELFKNL